MSAESIAERYVGYFIDPSLEPDEFAKKIAELRREFYKGRDGNQSWMLSVVKPALAVANEVRRIKEATVEDIARGEQ